MALEKHSLFEGTPERTLMRTLNENVVDEVAARGWTLKESPVDTDEDEMDLEIIQSATR